MGPGAAGTPAHGSRGLCHDGGMPDDDSTDQAPEPTDVRAAFKEALDRKQARDKAAHGEDHKDAAAVGKGGAAHQKRQFRRKSG